MFVVTGGGSGIGRALAHALAGLGHEVFIFGRHEQALQETAAFSALIHYACADVSTRLGRGLIQEALSPYPRLQGLVHNAGVIDPIEPMATLDEDAWRQVMATNLDAPFFLTQALQEQLIKGRVLHIGSGAAYFPVVGWAPYCVSKAGLAMLTRCSALEYQEIAFASVMPGIVDTAMQTTIRSAKKMTPSKRAFFNDLKAQDHLVLVETVALFLTWLLLTVDETTYVSKEWDIYDASHHDQWLLAPHRVPCLE